LGEVAPRRQVEAPVSQSVEGLAAAAAMVSLFSGFSSKGNAPEQEAMVSNSPSKKEKLGWDYYSKEDNMAVGCVGGVEDNPEVCPFIYRLHFDLANSYHWSGNFVKDYFYFVMQWHPLLGILMCHPNHPWSKLTRFAMFMLSAGLTFIPSCVITNIAAATESTLVGTDANDPNASHATSKGTEMILTLLFVTLPDVILGVFLYQLAIAETRCASCPCCIPIGKSIMKYSLIIAAVVVAINVSIGLAMLGGNPPVDALITLAKGKVFSYITWFPLWVVLPCQLGFVSLWNSEKKEADAAAANSVE